MGKAQEAFEPVPLYDEIAHLLTPLVLVAITAKIIYRSGGDDEFFDIPRHAIVTNSVIGLVEAAEWEGIEVVLDVLGFTISGALPTTSSTSFWASWGAP